jgi:IS5 family transposase
MSRSRLGTTIAAYWQRVQTTLFPYLATAGLTLTPVLERLVTILDLLRIEELVPARLHRLGAPPKDRAPLARAFVAKHVLNVPQTKAFRARLLTDDSLRRICGWATRAQVPSEATFSRAFAAFADLAVADAVHEQRVKDWLGETLIWEQALDATDITAREAAHPNPEPQYGRTASGQRRKHPISGQPTGRPKAGETREPPPTRLERQRTQVPEIALLELPTACDTGAKPDTHQHLHYWVGYKFHVVTNEDGIPLCALTTAASVHDSQVAIPLLQLTARRVTAWYDLMDAGYDAAAIRAASQALGHVPIIRESARPHAPAPEMEPDRARHYQGRTVAERFNARLKDAAGGRSVWVRGVRKVHAHLMFGLLGIFADALLHLNP